jgi:Icc-related predicted phosphoesterase
MVFRARKKNRRLSIFFATDIHGSEICFKKFLAAPAFYGADVCVLGGDMTGKMIVPLISQGADGYSARIAGREVTASGEDEVRALEARVRDSGFYPYRTNPDEMKELADDAARVEEIFHGEMAATLRRWGELAEQKYAGTDRVIYVAPGNDDPFFIDDVIGEIARFRLIEGEVVTIGDRYEMLATGYSNRTPWNTHREVDEDELRELIDKLAARLTNMESAVFNIHVPPFDTTIDEGPDINPETWDQKTSMGRSVTKPVGSVAVRQAIEDHQPMLSLHGHIHESRGVVRLGRTLAINPGSDYGDSVLRGCLVLLEGGRVAGHQLTSG